MSNFKTMANAYAEWLSQIAVNSATRMESAATAVEGGTYTINNFFQHCLQGWMDVFDLSPFVGASGILPYSTLVITKWPGGGGQTNPPIVVDDAAQAKVSNLYSQLGRDLTDPLNTGAATCGINLQPSADNKSVQVNVSSLVGAGTAAELDGHYLGFVYDEVGNILGSVHVHVKLT
jgi:hypothetical protein